MERTRASVGLDILKEEDDEGAAINSDDDETEIDTDSDTEALDGRNGGEPNKFDGLCDGVVSSMAMVKETLDSLLDLKDEMMKHSLPPTLLYQLSVVSGKVFRSISDLGMPVGELVRLVRLYSTPWEEKSAALKKLHEDYESKQRQLNIAIKRLQLVDAHSKRVAREKRIMNWEKLFSKMTSAKGHGRRWKFLIETIKEKAQLGLEHVQAYTQGLQDSSESEEEEEEEPASVQGMDAIEPTEPVTDDPTKPAADEKEETVKERSEDEESEASPSGQETDADDQTSRSSSPKKVRFEDSVTECQSAVETKDAQTWSHDPDFDRSLYLRIFCPEGLANTDLKCSLSCAGNVYKTPVFDEEETPNKDLIKTSGPEARPVQRPHAARKPGEERSNTEVSIDVKNNEASKYKKFYEFEIPLPDEIKDGVLVLGKRPEEPENIQLAVLQGQFEEIIAMTTIDFQEIKSLALHTVYLSPPHGDDEIQTKPRSNSFSDNSLDGSLSESMDIPLLDEDDIIQTAVNSADQQLKEQALTGVEPILFPVYSLQTRISDTNSAPSGKIPLLLYWGKRPRPLNFNRQCGTIGLNDLVYDLTGIDLSDTTKGDTNPTMEDKALSAIAFTPDTQEETVPKAAYEKLMEKHEEEMIYLQDEYEKRLQEMVMSLHAMQEQDNKTPVRSVRPASGSSRKSSPPIGSRHGSSHANDKSPNRVSPQQTTSRNKTPDRPEMYAQTTGELYSQEHNTELKHRPTPPKQQKTSRSFRVGKPLPKWGESLPSDFFERLQQWEEETRQHKQEVHERTLKDIKDNIEKKLAGQHKLSLREERVYDALKDVSLPALFMPFKRGNVYNPRAHQYFHPTGSTEARLTQPPSVFQLPPLPKNKMSVMNLFELSKNFHNKGPTWLVEKYLQQNEEPHLSSTNSVIGSCSLDEKIGSGSRRSTQEQEVES